MPHDVRFERRFRVRPRRTLTRAALCASLVFWGLAEWTGTARAQAGTVTPPSVVSHVDAIYPPSALAERKHGDVVLTVTVDADGHVSKVDVFQTGGDDLDEAAIVAIREWTFVPAMRDGKALPSRIRVPFHFAPPAAPPELVAPPAPAPGAVPELPSKNAVPAAPEPAPATPSATEQPPPPSEVTVRGSVTPQTHGASDIHIDVGALAAVPRQNASDYLKLAPGILLTNEGGEGHAEQVFLRGFDAREGQDIEFSVDGVPANDAGNIHGNGYADTHFVIPELIQSLRVTEGPFSPYQGNFAVAGSADYHLGLDTRGTTAKLTYGSFNTERLLLLWGPPGGSTGTFGGAEAYKTDGFGSNRAATRGSAMGQYELDAGSGAKLRVGGQVYTTHFQSAGVVREDDYEAGRVSFYGTEDPLQGGDSSRASVYADYSKESDTYALDQSLFVIRRDMRLREDFTGFLLDTQDALDTPHEQRGDLIDLNYGAWTVGGRGLARYSTMWNGLKQSLDVGYFARVDVVNSSQYRNTVPGDIPYKVETDLDSTLTDVGLYADASIHPVKLVTVRGGVRFDTFGFDVLNNCAAQGDFDNPSRQDPPINQSCHDQTLNGAHREPVQRSSTGATKAMPRVTAILGPIAHFNFTLSYGEGVRSIDPTYIGQDLDTPFASVKAYEGGVTYAHDFGWVDVSARSIFFDTHVDHDLVFDQTEGRNVLSNGTTRVGWTGAARLLGTFFDESANLTLVRPTFDDTHLQVPYVPTSVFREDAAFFANMPWRWGGRSPRGTLGIGYTYTGPRALPYNQLSDVVSVVDATANLAWKGWSAALAVTNLFDTKYRLGEYNYASDFRPPSEPPTLVPARQFAAGAPRGVFLTIGKTFGGDS